MEIDLQVWQGVLTILGSVVAFYFIVRKWVQDIAKNASTTVEQLKPSNGKTVAHMTEQTYKDMQKVVSKIDDHEGRLKLVEGLASHNVTRLDSHIQGHP